MLDAADIAILETHRENMNAVELGLLDELIRLRDENEETEKAIENVGELEEQLDEVRSALELANEEIADLKAQLSNSRDNELEADRLRNLAESRLEDLKSSMREVCA